jgi:hypothetical protein
VTAALVQELHLHPVDPFWIEPTWCAGDCVGGEALVGEGVLIETSRYHHATFADFIAVDRDTPAQHRVQIVIERCDSRDEPSTDGVALCVGAVHVLLNRAQRAALIDALTRAHGYSPTP